MGNSVSHSSEGIHTSSEVSTSYNRESKNVNGEEALEKEVEERIIYKPFVERKKYGVADVVVCSQSSRRAGNVI